MTEKLSPPIRPDVVVAKVGRAELGDASRSLSTPERLWSNDSVRRFAFVSALAVFWEVYARYVDDPLMLPTFSATARALFDGIVHGPLLERLWTSLQLLLIGYVAGIAAAAVLSALAVSSRFWADLLSTLTAMFNPLPAVALLPLALLWFGLGVRSIVFVIVHAVLWPVALNTHAGFRAVPGTLRMAGQNAGLEGLRFVAFILVPAAFPSILTGLQVGWAFAWRTLIAAELVFGAASRSGGLGWFIFEKKNQLETPSVFAGLVTVVLIGLFVENVVFRWIEQRTVKKWGAVR